MNKSKQPYVFKTHIKPISNNENTTHPIDFNGVYLNGLLISYEHTDLNSELDTINKSIVNINYNKAKQISSITELSNGIYTYQKINKNTGYKLPETIHNKKPIILKKWEYKYDKQGRLLENSLQLLADFFLEKEKEKIT